MDALVSMMVPATAQGRMIRGVRMFPSCEGMALSRVQWGWPGLSRYRCRYLVGARETRVKHSGTDCGAATPLRVEAWNLLPDRLPVLKSW